SNSAAKDLPVRTASNKPTTKQTAAPRRPIVTPQPKCDESIRYSLGPFPLTPALSLWERENCSPAHPEPGVYSGTERWKTVPLSPGERAGVRGNGAVESRVRRY